MSLTDKILKILTLVPVPFLPQAAQVVSAVLAVTHEARAEAVAAGLPPPTLEEEQAAVMEALRVAQEPWQRVKDAADAELKTGGVATRHPAGHDDHNDTGE